MRRALYGAGDEQLNQPLRVSVFVEHLQEVLDSSYPSIALIGEISGYQGPAASGHHYFALRDGDAKLGAALWRGTARRALRCPLEEGRKVVVHGRLDYYAPSGKLSLIVDRVEDVGEGDLAREFQKLKQKLQAEGLFDEARKRPLAARPWRVGLVTGAGSAALADIRQTWEEYAPPFEALFRAARVQGAAAASDCAAALRELAACGCNPILLARGGGSLEDLWAFNEEELVRAIVNCPVPVIAAVGHESDITLADLAADFRAKTPTAGAAELAVGWLEVRGELSRLGARLSGSLERRLHTEAARMESLTGALRACHPAIPIERAGGRLREAETRLVSGIAEKVRRSRRRLGWSTHRLSSASPEVATNQLLERLRGLDGRLRAISPMAVLNRGYALVEGPQGGYLRSAAEVEKDDPIRVQLAAGSLVARVESMERCEEERSETGETG